MMSIICSLRGHQPDRSRVRHDGTDFHAPCRRCGVALVRLDGGWRKDEAAEPLSPSRTP